MYKNNFVVSPYGMRSTASGAPTGFKVGTPLVIDGAGLHQTLYLRVDKASSFPKYSDRGPNLIVNIWSAMGQVDGYGAPAILATSISIDFGLVPSTARPYTYDITQYALGRLTVRADLQAGANPATARATYAVVVVGKGYS